MLKVTGNLLATQDPQFLTGISQLLGQNQQLMLIPAFGCKAHGRNFCQMISPIIRMTNRNTAAQTMTATVIKSQITHMTNCVTCSPRA